MLQTCDDVRTSRDGTVGRITLDRPAKLNALTLEMVRAMSAALGNWRDDPGISLVVIDGAGERGFCAGGDLRVLYDAARAGNGRAQAFWTEQYRLDATIARYGKPVVAFMSGTVMGGGVGLSAHARHRIATETTRLAMPEARIGLIPDVGGTWLLSRAPGETGTYLGLTSAHVDGADAIYMGFAEHFVPQASLAALLDALVEEAPPDDAAIRTVIARFAGSPGIAPLTQYAPLIDRTFAHDTVEEILDALHRDGSAFALSTERQIGANSPTSLKLTLRALREARRLTSLGDCIKLEFRVMNRTLSGHDLYEGARAVIIEKDRSPKWQPSDLADVSPHVLDHYFAPLADGELQL